MKAILIDPNTKSVARIDISKDARLSEFFGEKPRIAMKFPKGDILFAGVQGRAEAFTMGGSRPIAGPGLIVGRRMEPRERSPALVRLDDVVTMVRWTAIEVRPKPPAAVRAIVIDPEQDLIEEVLIAPNRLAVMKFLGAEIGSLMRVPGNDHVFSSASGTASPSCWRKDDLTFSSRSVIVGRDSETDDFADVMTSLENLRSSVEFRAPGESCWTSYTDRKAHAGRPPAT
ncbi:hypothetical protein [Bradyrhizobium canariense]|uniref:Uncharacterized protein n=1 Tax=Bradyrhizobium canariense TaxID=255045 RepID=A0A1X3G1S6_9BRAD|nr:hypothetical protein [Bradyrhizobium canariense]OSI73301.1 hypothetical protein BSZ22_07805 [Bradyrhizobium canariense]OSI79023.1 hypothetical protein BSZ23_16485 [Bradyrhizobium canariense]OSI89951.1 hypothetical protein BSZ25_19425 [Bradyrhizobium canariense]OSI92661.1 hypothetical protein BSZ24_14340 [Bradyrhizobium canariense]OSJ08263.1 hypothetical protein BSZ16_07630 [Bradyrhizobium canariense]